MLGTVFASHCEVNISEYQSDLSPTMNLNCTHFTFPTQITRAGDTRHAILGSGSCTAINGQHREWRIYLDVSHNHLYQEEKGES